MSKKRVVVTGMGIVSCFGNDIDKFFQSLLNGESGISQITCFDTTEFPTKIAGEIKDFDVGDYLDKKQSRRIDKFIGYSVVAGKKALEHAGFDLKSIDNLNKSKCGVIIGSGMGGMSNFADGVLTLNERGSNRVSPFFIPYILTNMAGAIIAMEYGFMGPNYSISTACATGNNSIIAAANHIINGDADIMITGGAEAPITPMGLAGFCACKALSKENDHPQEASRPWDKQRDGFVMGEGAGVLVLESYEHAKARGAVIYAEIYGGGISSDAYHITEPRSDGEGVALCIRNALNNAQINADEVNYINAHATSTPLGDMAEVKAAKLVFKNPKAIAMNATKSMIGHGLGAAGGIEAIVTVLTIYKGLIHPTINLNNPEDNLEFHIPTKMQERNVNIGISNSFGFGGHNATLVFGKLRKD